VANKEVAILTKRWNMILNIDLSISSENEIYSSEEKNYSSRKLLRNTKYKPHLSDAHFVFAIYFDVTNI